MLLTSSHSVFNLSFQYLSLKGVHFKKLCIFYFVSKIYFHNSPHTEQRQKALNIVCVYFFLFKRTFFCTFYLFSNCFSLLGWEVCNITTLHIMIHVYFTLAAEKGKIILTKTLLQPFLKSFFSFATKE